MSLLRNLYKKFPIRFPISTNTAMGMQIITISIWQVLGNLNLWLSYWHLLTGTKTSEKPLNESFAKANVSDFVNNIHVCWSIHISLLVLHNFQHEWNVFGWWQAALRINPQKVHFINFCSPFYMFLMKRKKLIRLLQYL